MESIKPVVEQEVILSLLEESFHSPIAGLTQLQGGLISETLSFQVDEKEYILRFAPHGIETGYKKEFFIFQQFASYAIPIPPIIKCGWYENLYYAISEKLPGQGLNFISEEEYRQTIPSIIQTLSAIHQIDVQQWHGFGWIDENGIGKLPSWKDFILSVIEEEPATGFYGKWHIMFQTTFLERDFFETVYSQMSQLLEKCPQERYLVHGGYGYNNVLARDGKVTAVVDWVDAMYGDFVYDIAWIAQWAPYGIDYARLFHQYYTNNKVPLPNYRERMNCYQLYMGLDGMRFFAKTKNQEAYQATRQKLQNLLSTL